MSFGVMLALAGAAFPSTIVNVKFVGAGTTVSDPSGTPVEPYKIEIDGVPQLVACYDVLDVVHVGDTWPAYEYSLSEAVANGMFHTGFGDPQLGYQSVGWLSAQTYANADQEVALQYAIWGVFDHISNLSPLTANETAAYNNYETALNAEKTYVDPITHTLTAFGNFDFSHTVFLEPTTGAVGHPGTEQPFVFAITTGPGNTSSTPEPGTLVMIGSGLLCLLSSLGFKRFAGKNG